MPVIDHLCPDTRTRFRASEAHTRLRILVVEDNVDGAESTATLMQLYGYEVCVALDGPAALLAVQDNQPDVVLLDIGLPGMDGCEVARQMREHFREKAPFFIAITGYGRETDRQRSREAGIDLHLLKPVDPETLHQVLNRFARVVLPPQ